METFMTEKSMAVNSLNRLVLLFIKYCQSNLCSFHVNIRSKMLTKNGETRGAAALPFYFYSEDGW